MWDILNDIGFTVDDPAPAIWYKSGRPGMARQPDLILASNYETFWYARKGRPGIQKPGRPNVFDFPTPTTNRIHPTERPIEMIQTLLSTFVTPASRIIVPFAGSGNTLLAAANLRMTGVAFDICDKYRPNFVIRAKEKPIGSYGSY